MCVYAVLCAAAVHHWGAGVTVVACRSMAENTQRQTAIISLYPREIKVCERFCAAVAWRLKNYSVNKISTKKLGNQNPSL